MDEIIGLDWIGLDRIIGWDYWILYLDDFSSQTLMGPAARRGIPRRGVFFCYVIFSKMVINDENVISGPDFLKNDDIWSNFIKLGLDGSNGSK